MWSGGKLSFWKVMSAWSMVATSQDLVPSFIPQWTNILDTLSFILWDLSNLDILVPLKAKTVEAKMIKLLYPTDQTKPQLGMNFSQTAPQSLHCSVMNATACFIICFCEVSDLRYLSLKDKKELWKFISTKTNQVYWASAFPKFKGQSLSPDSAQLKND